MNDSSLKRSQSSQPKHENWRPVRFIVILVVMALVNWWVSSSQGQIDPPAEYRLAATTADSDTPESMAPADALQSAESTNPLLWHTNYDQALELADRDRVPVLIYFSGDETWCQWCRKLESEVFQTDAFAAWAEGRAVLLEIRYPKMPRASDVRTIRTMRIIRRYKGWITGYPTVLIISPREDVLGKLGYVPGGVHVWIQQAQPFVGQKDKVAIAD